MLMNVLDGRSLAGGSLRLVDGPGVAWSEKSSRLCPYKLWEGRLERGSNESARLLRLAGGWPSLCTVADGGFSMSVACSI
jgi:hypothetical protein